MIKMFIRRITQKRKKLSKKEIISIKEFQEDYQALLKENAFLEECLTHPKHTTLQYEDILKALVENEEKIRALQNR